MNPPLSASIAPPRVCRRIAREVGNQATSTGSHGLQNHGGLAGHAGERHGSIHTVAIQLLHPAPGVLGRVARGDLDSRRLLHACERLRRITGRLRREKVKERA